MTIGNVNLGQELLNVPMGDMIKQMAMSIAEGQWELDKTSMTVAEFMSGQRLLRDVDTGELINVMPDGSPRILDSRVYFGYTYEEDPEVYKTRSLGKVWTVPSFTITYDAASSVDAQNSADALKGKEYSATSLADAKTLFDADVDSTGLAAVDITKVKAKLTASHESEKTERIPVLVRKPNKISMMELGFTPNFYQFVDTVIEVKIAIKITGTTEATTTSSAASANVESQQSSSDSSTYRAGGHSSNSRSWWWGNRYHNWGYGKTANRDTAQRKTQSVVTSQVDATYSNKFSYEAAGSSLLRTKLMPVPPPAVLEERIREVMEFERDYLDRINSGDAFPKYE